MTKKSLGTLLQEAEILQPAAQLTKEFGKLNVTLIQILQHYFVEKQVVIVELKRGRTHAIPGYYDEYRIGYGDNYQFTIPVRELKHQDEGLEEKVRIKMNEMNKINLEKFVWAYSNCSSEHRTDGVVPVFFGHNSNFNDVYVEFDPDVDRTEVFTDADIPDHFGEWGLAKTEHVTLFTYKSCTGSEVTIARQGEQFVVTHTKSVGLTTYKRLCDAGYEGDVDRRPFVRAMCEHGHETQLEGDNVDIVWETCEVCGSRLAGNKDDARLVAKVQAWWRNMGKFNFPLAVSVNSWGFYHTENHERTIRTSGDKGLEAALAEYGIPVDTLKAFSVQELKDQFEIGQAARAGLSACEEADLVARRAAYALAKTQAAQKGVEIWDFEIPKTLPDEQYIEP